MAKRTGWWRLATALICLSQPSWAQSPARTLPVPATSSWQHAMTGMILPPRAAGLTRGPVIDRTDAEQDVSTEYRDGENSLAATVYLYRSGLPDASIWFDRGLTAILVQPRFGLTGTALPAPTAFARPGGGSASGLRATLAGANAEVKSTALAVVPLGRWLLKVRMSATQLDAAALDARLSAFIAALRWPAEAKPLPPAAAVQPCPTPLVLKRAKQVRDDLGNVLVNAIAGSLTLAPAEGEEEEEEARPVAYCREGAARAEHAVYRPDAATDRYVVALGDAGIVLSVAPSLGAAFLGGKGKVSMTLLERSSTAVLPSFNRLPPPDQALSVALRGSPSVSSSTGD